MYKISLLILWVRNSDIAMAGVVQGRGLKSSEGWFTPISVGNGGCCLEHLCVVSPCSVGFLTTWRL